MSEGYNIVEPDVNFVKEIMEVGGDTVKKCFQCATCSVVCPISPDNKPFPRKEMIAASWGLKDKVVKNMDIWLCHQCGDCTAQCPRGANPGDVLGAIRSLAISEYATPKIIAKAVNDPKQLPLLFFIPALIMIALGMITGQLHFSPEGSEVVHAHFFSTLLVDLIFVPLSIWAVAVFGLGLKRFLDDIHENAVMEKKTKITSIDIKGFIQALINVIPVILRHDKFNECGENKERSTPHTMVLFGFIGLAVVTGIFFVVLYVFHIEGPYRQLNPVKWIANLSGLMLVIGSSMMIINRLNNQEQVSTYKDWYLLGLVFGLGFTGLLTEMTRLGGLAGISYFLYFVHLVFVFNLMAFLPFSKLAHLVYRTVAMTYAEYSKR
ncbi:MAG: quinone-interacting membrane-bound oxidoreductase complex subunit QmoC [Desulfobacterales bacterium]|nr:quinone-interacting membrane-bound oxidoreductase complex subunit QmoC [Desulfobacterales bacterium]